MHKPIPMTSPLPVHILTGFLGAGKTTFLNRCIQARAGERVLVIENEIGSVNIDAKLIVEGVQDVLPLTAGCLCCSMNEGLIDLLEAASRRSSEFDRLIIETTGIADPESIAYPFLAHPAVARNFDLRSVICLADAAHIRQWIAETEEARRQIGFADVILLNKTDLVADAEKKALIAELKGINPFAQVFEGSQGDFPIEEILHIQQLKDEGAAQQVQTLSLAHRHLSHDIHTFTLSYDRPFDLKALQHELTKVLTLSRHQIYRIKGLIQAGQSPVQVVLQSVSSSLYLSDGVPWNCPPSERVSKIVCIGKGIQKESMDRIFSRALR